VVLAGESIVKNVAFLETGLYSHRHERDGALRTHRHDQDEHLDVDYRHRDYSLACRAGCGLTDIEVTNTKPERQAGAKSPRFFDA
jgi:hypothetical protein